MKLFFYILQALRQIYKQIMFNFFAHHVLLEGDFQLNDIKVEEEIGQGNSHVYTAVIKEERLALKQIEIKSDYQYQSFLREISFMRELSESSHSIVKYKGYMLTKMERNQYDRKKYAFIVMESAESNLQQYISSKRSPLTRASLKELDILVSQMLGAFASLEERDIAHCDIKPENILIMDSSACLLKLCDVGSCKIVSIEERQEETIHGTIPFQAPELVKIKASKIVASNPFKSDVFSFGLVLLYMITLKKFKSLERLELDQPTYKQIIQEWIREARELTDHDPVICEVLKLSLEFDEFKRMMFKELKNVYQTQKKKKEESQAIWKQKLEKEDELKQRKQGKSPRQMKEGRDIKKKMNESGYNSYNSVPISSNQVTLFKERRKLTQKLPTLKTTMTGNAFKLARERNYSPTFLSKRTISLECNSPGKNPNHYAFTQLPNLNRIIYITNLTVLTLPLELPSQEKIFVLAVPQFKYKSAEVITILPTCGLQVVYQLQEVDCDKLYIEHQEAEEAGLSNDAPPFPFRKIRANFAKCKLSNGFYGVFKSIAHSQLELLDLQLTESECTFKELMLLIELLLTESPKLNSFFLCWERQNLMEEEHVILTEKLAKLPIKKLILILNQRYIHYEKSIRWPLPKNCETLYLEYANNLLSSIMTNLAISIQSTPTLKQLYLNFQNNGLLKGDIHVLAKAIASLQQLEKLVINLAFNKLEDLKYLQTVLSELITVWSLEIKLHRTEVPTDKILQFISSLLDLFLNCNLKILKVTCNRNVPLHELQSQVKNAFFKEDQNKYKSIKFHIIGFDNKYYLISFSKRGKITKAKGAIGKKKQETNGKKLQLPRLSPSSSPQNTNQSFPEMNGPKSTQICSQLLTLSQSFNNYLCLSCIQLSQVAKNTYYCKFCIKNCMHKEHTIMRVTERSICSCGYSQKCCCSLREPGMCVDSLFKGMKKEYRCYKCEIDSMCKECVRECLDMHSQWVKTSKQLRYFKCRGVQAKSSTHSPN